MPTNPVQMSAPSPRYAPGASTAEDRSLRGLIGLIAVLTVGRLIAAGVTPLSEDEAYYRLWSQHLAFGYFDHPPMVAWWIAAGRALVGDTALGARLLPCLATALCSVLIYGIARQCRATSATAARAAVWYKATLLVGFGGHLIVPDVPSSLFWTATVYLLLRSRDGGAGIWGLAGVTAGLAVLSKYSALFLAPGVFVWLVSSAEGRDRLRTPWPWVCLAAAALVASTNVIWNATHDWVSFDKQFGRAAADRFTPRHLLELIGTQFLLINPLMAPFALAGLRRAVARRVLPLDGRWLLAAVTLPFAAYLVLHSLHAGVQGHWPAPLYPGLALLAALAAERASGWLRLSARWVAPVGAAVSLFALIHLALPATDWFGRIDLSGQMRGWPVFADRVETLRLQTGAAWVGALSFGQVGMLDNERRIQAPILQIIERSRYRFQPPPSAATLARPGLIVDFSRRVTAGDLQGCFARVTPLGEIQRGGDARPPPALQRLGLGPRQYTYALFLVQGPKVDLARDGCWEAKTLADSLRARQRREAR